MARILYISGSLNYGAPGRIVEQTGLLAQENGFDVLVAHSTRMANPSLLPNFAVTTKCQEYFHALGALCLDFHGLFSINETKKLVKKVQEYKPDIIHLHNIHGYFLNFRILFEYLDTLDIPVVWTLHDCWSFTGRCFHFVGVDCYKWKTECYDCPAEKGYTVSPFCDRSKQLFNLKKQLFPAVKNLFLVPVSDWLASFIPDSFLNGCKVEVIHNGVDLEKFSPKNGRRLRLRHKIEDKFVLLGVAAPWNKRKGLDDFCRLRSLLSDDFSIILVGLNEKQIKTLPPGIIGVDRTESQEELAEYYSMADAFVNLTYLDTFPTVNLEALACGTPVITYNTGGSPEAIDERTGIVVEQGDVNGIVNAIQRLYINPLSSEDCRERAERYFDKGKCFAKYISMYDSLVKNK